MFDCKDIEIQTNIPVEFCRELYKLPWSDLTKRNFRKKIPLETVDQYKVRAIRIIRDKTMFSEEMTYKEVPIEMLVYGKRCGSVDVSMKKAGKIPKYGGSFCEFR